MLYEYQLIADLLLLYLQTHISYYSLYVYSYIFTNYINYIKDHTLDLSRT